MRKGRKHESEQERGEHARKKRLSKKDEEEQER